MCSKVVADFAASPFIATTTFVIYVLIPSLILIRVLVIVILVVAVPAGAEAVNYQQLYTYIQHTLYV